MADTRSSTVVCKDGCGCPFPCPGGVSCRCNSSVAGGKFDESSMDHKRCSCGKHCGCNPCTCSKTTSTVSSTAGKAFCSCGDGCTCVTCAT